MFLCKPEIYRLTFDRWWYKVVQIWPGQTVTCLHTNHPVHIWTTLWFFRYVSLLYTRWFKYDRDKLWLVYTQLVLVIFEPPCTYTDIRIIGSGNVFRQLTIAHYNNPYSPCFTPVRSTTYCSNAACQFTPLLTLRSPVFGFTPFHWFTCICFCFFSGISFSIYVFFIYAHFFRNATRA